MVDKSYVIVPRDIENGSQIIEKVFNQMCLLNLLQKKHRLIPEVDFKKISLNELLTDKYHSVPRIFSEDEITLLKLYGREEINRFKDVNNTGNFVLPFPCFYQEGLHKYEMIATSLSDSNSWIFQLIKFFSFLTIEGYRLTIDGVEPGDFLYDQDGNLMYFTGYSQLTLNKGKDLLDNNLLSLAHLFYNYYIKDTEKHEARLYQQSWFEKLEGRLIEPLIYGKYSAQMYSDFQEILLDMEGKLKSAPDSRTRTGIFLDTANILTPLYSGFSKIRIDFDHLLVSIYGKLDSWKIDTRIAVMFLPTYQGEVNRDDKYTLIMEIKEDLESYGFQVLVVENETAVAKHITKGKVEDVDDIKLIEVMGKYKNRLDRALLLTGDGHFYDIAYQYKQAGKEIKLVSITEESTSKQLVNNFDHKYIYDYHDCLEFI